jgi:hypothetical protein
VGLLSAALALGVLAAAARKTQARISTRISATKKTEDMKVIPARAESANFLQSEPEGLRITLPAGPLRQRETGVSPQFDISGDFEITAGYEIIEADQNGSASFEIYLQTNAPTKEALALHRTLGPDSSGYYFVTRMGGSELPPCPNL